MGTGWRRAFCTTIPRDPSDHSSSNSDQKHQLSSSPSPRSCGKLGFFSGGGGSNPSTPRLQSQPVSSPSLRCRTQVDAAAAAAAHGAETPRLNCKTGTPKKCKSSPRTTSLLSSNPSSPRSPLKLSLFKNSFKFRSSCGICLNSVKTGQGTAIYTAECTHAFHFPCIADHVRKHAALVCPVCSVTWTDVPLLALHQSLSPAKEDRSQNDAVVNPPSKPKTEVKQIRVESSPRAVNLSPRKPDFRSYDDDEPLLSPTASGIFVPIPEADENVDEEDDDVEEFQGFFVNPTPSVTKSCDDSQNGRDFRNVEVKLLPESAVVSASRSHETYAMVLRVKAPPAPPVPARSSSGNTAAALLEPTHRAPIDLVTVLDVSGSMTGAKLQMLKRAMRLVISSLGSADRLSIVSFSAAPKRLLPLKRMTSQGQCAARRIIDRLVIGEGTSVGDALRKATRVLEDRRERNPVASIMLLSDGHDDRVQSTANQRQGSSHGSTTRFAHMEIPVQSFGYTQDPAEDAFAKCVGGLLSVVVQDLRLELSFAAGSAPAEITAVYSCNGRPTVLNSGYVRIGDLYAGEDRELLVELRVPAAAVGAHHVMSVKRSYKDPATQEVYYGREQALLVPRPHAVRSSAPKIERLRNLFITTRAIAESRRLIDHGGDHSSAHNLLASARALIMQSGSVAGDEYVRGLEGELAELHWRRQQLSGTPRRRGGEREAVVATDENGEPLTPSSAWRAAEKLAKVAVMKKSLNRVRDLHGFENARF